MKHTHILGTDVPRATEYPMRLLLAKDNRHNFCYFKKKQWMLYM